MFKRYPNLLERIRTRIYVPVDNPMAISDKRKQSLYFPEDMLKEIQLEANRQDRSLSWIVQKAWKLARRDIMKFPSVNDVADDDEPDSAANGE